MEEEARRCQRLVLWIDFDREGENIAYEVIGVCIGLWTCVRLILTNLTEGDPYQVLFFINMWESDKSY